MIHPVDEPKKKEAPIVLLEEIFPGDTNAYGTAFGGKILALMDRAAGLVASRFARLHFVTASLDAMEFRAPVKQGEIAEVEARVVYTSRHTCGVKVRVFAVDKTRWERNPCGQGMFFMVAMGPEGKPMPIPQWTPGNETERRAHEEASAVHRAMLDRKKT
jgi:acyl-CoA hydrolase